MPLENNEPKKDVQDQVKEILANIGGEVSDFFSQPAPAEAGEKTSNWGKLYTITLGFLCSNCEVLHVTVLDPEGFIKLFAGKHAKNYFDNFAAIGMFRAGEPLTATELEKRLEEEEQANNGLVQKLEDQVKANEQIRCDLRYVQALADDVQIKNSHLQSENKTLRLQLDRLRAAQDQQQMMEGPTQTALDYQPVPPKRVFSLWARITKIRVIG